MFEKLFRPLTTFHGGITPSEKNTPSTLTIRPLSPPKTICFEVDLSKPYECLVTQGQMVNLADTVFSSRSKQFSAILSSAAGTVASIGVTEHTMRVTIETASITPPFHSEANRTEPLLQTSEELNQHIQAAHIIGMGGGGFPTARKVQSRPIKTILINACQCEPLVSCDTALLHSDVDAVLLGAIALKKATQAEDICIVIEARESKIIEMMTDSATWKTFHQSEALSIQTMPTIYPSGSEKQMVEVLYHEEIPSQHYLKDLAKLSFNVATAFAVYQHLWHQLPPTQRLISFIDLPNQTTINVWATLGMNASDVLQQCGRLLLPSELLLAGGLMMGVEITPSYTIKATTHSLLIKTREAAVTRPCIRCGACADVCPIRLLPQQLYFFSLSDHDEALANHQLFDCIECGCCAYVCPSQIPLVEHYQLAKKRISTQQSQQAASEWARMRFESREQRIAQEKVEREARLKAKREQAKAQIKAKQADSPSTTATLSAVERAKAAALKRKQLSK